MLNMNMKACCVQVQELVAVAEKIKGRVTEALLKRCQASRAITKPHHASLGPAGFLRLWQNGALRRTDEQGKVLGREFFPGS